MIRGGSPGARELPGRLGGRKPTWGKAGGGERGLAHPVAGRFPLIASHLQFCFCLFKNCLKITARWTVKLK